MKSIHFSIHASHRHLLKPRLHARHLLGVGPGEGQQFWDGDAKRNEIQAVSLKSSWGSGGHQVMGGGVPL